MSTAPTFLRAVTSSFVARVAIAVACSLSVVSQAQTVAKKSAAAVKSIHMEVSEATITQLQTAMVNGTVTSAQLVDAYLARIAAYDHAGPALNSLIRINPNARAQAAQLDSERRAGHTRGSLHGIPIIIKDNYDTEDMPTSAGSIALANSRPAHDAFVVQQLRKAGAVIVGKSNLHELAAGITSVSSLGGQTRNPYDPARCPGGSSGGTGAAIAASFATVGWGSDTCGSIRIPSAYGSLFGLRPTQGLVSRHGIVPLSHTQDIGGPLARTATDLAIALDVTVGYDPADSVTQALRDRAVPKFQASLDKAALNGARIGVFRPYFLDTDPEISEIVRHALDDMKRQGATVIDVQVPEFDTLFANSTVLNMETKFDLAAYLQTVPNAPVHSLKEIVDAGMFDRALEVRFRTVDTMTSLESEPRKIALARQANLRARMQRIMDSLSLDALAYPTMRQKPVLIGEVQTGSTCGLSAQSGLPAISMPAGFMAEGLPVAIELLGRAFTDTRLVSLAYAFEQTGAKRRAPESTPPLEHGVAPSAKALALTAASSNVSAIGKFAYDQTRARLKWSVTLSGPRQNDMVAVVIRRAGAAPEADGPVTSQRTRVVARLLGPDMRNSSGEIALNSYERAALRDGQLALVLYTNGAKPVTSPMRFNER